MLLTACNNGDSTGPVTTGEPSQETRGEFAMAGGGPGEFVYALPESVPAGGYDFVFTNNGEEFHHAQIYRLKAGTSFADFQETLLSADTAGTGLPEQAGELVEGPPTGVAVNVGPGKEGRARGVLEPGSYVVICFVHDTGGTSLPHYALGMLSGFEVSPAPEG